MPDSNSVDRRAMNTIDEQEASIAESLARAGISYPKAQPAPVLQMPTTEIVSAPTTMPTTEISAPAALTMPTTEIAAPLLPGQHADPPPVAISPGAAIPANAATANTPFVDYSGMNPMAAHGVTPIANGASPFVDTSGITAPSPGGASTAQPAPPPPDPNGVIPPATYVPAHFDDTRINETPETVAAKLQTYDAQADAQKNTAMSQALQSRVTADQMAQEADRANQSLANQTAKEDERQQFVKSHLARLDTLSQDLSNQTVNPHQWWDNASLFQKAMAGIAITLGGGPAAVNGGHNVGLDMVNSAIQANIDAQKTNLELKRVGLHEQGNVLEQYRAAFGDDRLGEIALEHSLRQNAIDKMKADSAAGAPQQIIDAAKFANAQLEREQLSTKASFEHLAYVKAHMTGGPAAMQKVDPALLVKLPNGENFIAPTKEEAAEVRDRSGALQNIKDNMNKALAIRKDASVADLANPYSKAHKMLEGLQKETAIQMVRLNVKGRMNENEIEAMNGAMGSFTGIQDNNDAVIEAARSRIESQFTNEVRALGSEQVQRGYTRDQQGRIEPGARYVGRADTPRTGGVAPSSFKPAGQ